MFCLISILIIIFFQTQMTDESAITRSLVLALGVCYHACLKNRDEYRECVVQHFQQPCEPVTADAMEKDIIR